MMSGAVSADMTMLPGLFIADKIHLPEMPRRQGDNVTARNCIYCFVLDR
jgi:hypothetical protein